MPRTHTRHYTIRPEQCDPHGELDGPSLLRYMQGAAIEATAAAGYDEQRYRAEQSIWLVRSSEFERLLPLRQGERVSVTTWVADFRRATSRRQYEFHLADGRLAARAATLWVYLDTASGRPIAIPPDLAQAFIPELAGPNPPQVTLERSPFPKPPPATAQVFTYTHTVVETDLDQLRHVNNTNYLVLAEAAGQAALAACGWDTARLHASGARLATRQAQLQYLTQARLGDLLQIRTWVYAAGSASFWRYCEMRRGSDHELVAEVHSHFAWLDPSGSLPVQAPSGFLASLEPTLAA